LHSQIIADQKDTTTAEIVPETEAGKNGPFGEDTDQGSKKDTTTPEMVPNTDQGCESCTLKYK
jgi:hypothetical protein